MNDGATPNAARAASCNRTAGSTDTTRARATLSAMRSRGFLVVISLVASLTATSIATVSTATAAVPTGFSDTLLFSVSSPTAIAFTPDGRMLVTTQGGALRVVTAGGSLVATPAVTVPNVCSDSRTRAARGRCRSHVLQQPFHLPLLHDQRDRLVSKSRESMEVEQQATSRRDEFVLIDRIHSTAGNHNGGDLNFGFGGLLYVERRRRRVRLRDADELRRRQRRRS